MIPNSVMIGSNATQSCFSTAFINDDTVLETADETIVLTIGPVISGVEVIQQRVSITITIMDNDGIKFDYRWHDMYKMLF